MLCLRYVNVSYYLGDLVLSPTLSLISYAFLYFSYLSFYLSLPGHNTPYLRTFSGAMGKTILLSYFVVKTISYLSLEFKESEGVNKRLFISFDVIDISTSKWFNAISFITSYHLISLHIVLTECRQINHIDYKHICLH